jgi:putative copper export protein
MHGVLRFLHLVAASAWVGGMITVAAIVPALRRAGADPAMVRAVAARFGVLAWSAMAVAIATGVAALIDAPTAVAGSALAIKLALVGLAVSLAWLHQMIARNITPAARGIVQGLLLLLGLGIIAAAIAL